MELSLDTRVQQLITDRVNSGRYASPEDVVAAALFALTHEEGFGDFAPGELDRLISEGEASGPPVDGKTFLAEWRALRSREKASRS